MGLGAALGLALNWTGSQGMIDVDTVGKAATIGKELRDLFLRPLQMLVVPLIVSSLITGVTGMGDLRTLGSIGGRTIAFYLITSLLAIVVGLLIHATLTLPTILKLASGRSPFGVCEGAHHRIGNGLQHGLQQRHPPAHDAKRGGFRGEARGGLVRVATRREHQHGRNRSL